MDRPFLQYGFLINDLLLHDRSRDEGLVQILIRAQSGVHAEFSPDGNHTVWGNADGSVSVCDWPMIRHHLGAIGLGW